MFLAAVIQLSRGIRQASLALAEIHLGWVAVARVPSLAHRHFRVPGGSAEEP